MKSQKRASGYISLRIVSATKRVGALMVVSSELPSLKSTLNLYSFIILRDISRVHENGLVVARIVWNFDLAEY